MNGQGTFQKKYNREGQPKHFWTRIILYISKTKVPYNNHTDTLTIIVYVLLETLSALTAEELQ